MFSKVVVTVGMAALTNAVLPVDELVTSLPDIGDITKKSWQMYSGYAKVTETKQLHYVLVTSKRDMATDPL